MATTPYEKRRRKKYIARFKAQLIGPERMQALETYAKRMVALGLYSTKTYKKDVYFFIMNTAAKLSGFRWYGDWLKANGIKRWW